MLNHKSLREQIYHYVRSQMLSGKLLPGATVDVNKLSKDLGVSKTPLRDALIMLERDGFVEILPRKGFLIRSLSLEDVRNLYDVIGALEAMVLRRHFADMDRRHFDLMDQLNQQMRQAVENQDFDSYYELNLDFHSVYLNLSPNRELINYLDIQKRRLYDFPRRSYIKAWELSNCDEHQQVAGLLRAGALEGAVSVLRDVHWSFKVQEKNIRKFYQLVDAQIQDKLSEAAA